MIRHDSALPPSIAAPALSRGPGSPGTASICGPGPRISAALRPGWHRGAALGPGCVMKCHDLSCSAVRFAPPPHFCRNSPRQTGLYFVFFLAGLMAKRPPKTQYVAVSGWSEHKILRLVIRNFFTHFIDKVYFHTILSCMPASPSESAPRSRAPRAAPARRRPARRKRNNVHIMFLYPPSSGFRAFFAPPLSAGRALSRSRSAVRRSTA